jgi:hypothetical protein
MGSPFEKVIIKIPVITQIVPEITNAAVMNSPRLVVRAIATRTAAAIIKRIAAVKYLFSVMRFIIFPC